MGELGNNGSPAPLASILGPDDVIILRTHEVPANAFADPQRGLPLYARLLPSRTKEIAIDLRRCLNQCPRRQTKSL